ncbi:MAG: 50S ribosomal protein L9 [Candidatus Komeilibacteria bacterium RIFOXYC1_FULL_37_11]|uniref:Large ribosomal subunit protein bL9 n=1 Tax=Candidatus Komeilibacteria bacterium RIFOXYC1_FULL_37_11 TaxID=1798555 RepID=A0A1G2BYN7_9BACT|nr:MAG: 50S ribosomal protein L9 [Candidatus Komeilibacteria bacterium RIFOXYC1_FULL_37_11]OGY96056.1 MAG: 50S ribosomal protein L9 [Candidatus Komeilibacteria bacterium RIFOXYD1_FULL_37_29]
MKVILLEDIKSLGARGDIKDVSDGYATNFLLSQGKAILATGSSVAQLKAQQNRVVAKKEAQVGQYEKIVKTLNKQSVLFVSKVSEKNTLFKGVSTDDIIVAVKDKFNLDISANWFVKPSLLKNLGKHNVFLRLPNNQLISFFVNIKAE